MVAPAEDQQLQARALGDPTRYRLFRYIVDAARPVGVAELTDLVQLNHNAVRQHLAVLKDASLVTEEMETRARVGRPRLLYRLHPEVAGSWETPGPYAWLAQLLSEAIRRHEDPRQLGRDEGRRIASGLRGGSRLEALEEEMARRGFRPTKVERGRHLEFVLGRCPFADVAANEPDVVCQLHLGLAEGLADGLGELEVERLVAKRAERAGCRLILRRRTRMGDLPQRVHSTSTRERGALDDDDK